MTEIGWSAGDEGVLFPVHRYRVGKRRLAQDLLVAEAPLELYLNDLPLLTFMRSPGSDHVLCLGHLWSEGIIEAGADLSSFTPCPRSPTTRCYAWLSDRVPLPERPRQGVLNASCGLCGLERAELLKRKWAPRQPPLILSHREAFQLTEALRERQPLFQATGGAHGSALFNDQLQLIDRPYEDLGRHNALDKALGALLLAEPDPDLHAPFGIVTSSRVSSELVQKALVCGASALVAVGAASTLAHQLAIEGGLWLYSFIRAKSGNLHAPTRRAELVEG